MGKIRQQEMLTVREVADRLRVGIGTAYRLMRSPGFPSVRVGGQIRVPVAAFEAWLAAGGSERCVGQPST